MLGEVAWDGETGVIRCECGRPAVAGKEKDGRIKVDHEIGGQEFPLRNDTLAFSCYATIGCKHPSRVHEVLAAAVHDLEKESRVPREDTQGLNWKLLPVSIKGHSGIY